MKFEHGTSYPIDTLPDDLHDETITNCARWAIKDALFWNDCQGWWIDHIADMRRDVDFGGGKSVARFWQPLPIDPMTREQVLAERGMDICPDCDVARDIRKPHTCHESSLTIVREQRLLQDSLRAVGEARDPK